MHRSASWNRFSDEYYSRSSPALAQSSKPEQALRLSSSFGANELPTNDPVAVVVKREKARVKFAETAVHVIPLVLLLCTIVLWFFSNPEIDVGNVTRGETIAASIQGLTIEGELESEIPILDTASSHPSNQLHDPSSMLKIKRLI